MNVPPKSIQGLAPSTTGHPGASQDMGGDSRAKGNCVRSPEHPDRKGSWGLGVLTNPVPQFCFDFFIVRLCLELLFQLLEESERG